MRPLRPLAVLLAVLALALSLRLAEAKGDPINPGDYARLTEWILHPKDPAERTGALSYLLAAPRDTHPEAYGQVLGPVFRDADRTGTMSAEDRRAMYATVIAHLADAQANGEDLLLVRDFLPLLAEDAKLVDAVRALLKPDLRNPGVKLGWRLILQHAAELLGDPDATVRRSALRVSAHCECVREADTLAALHAALKQVGPGAPREDAEAFLAAAERLLKYRFSDVSALLNFLGSHSERLDRLQAADVTDADRYRIRAEFLADVIDLYRAQGGEGIRKARAAALAYGQTVIQKAEKPADLLVFFDPKRERFEELQREAIQAAAPPRMKPVPDVAWADLLIGALRHSDDAAVLDRVVAVIGETFPEASGPTQQLAEAVAERLARGADIDSQPQRLALASILGSIGVRKTVREALPPRLGDVHADQKEVMAQLIRDLGLVRDGLVIQLPPYYRAGKRLGPEWARVAVAGALGLPGFRNSREQRPAAAMMLHHILTGEAVRAVKIVADPAKPEAFEVRAYAGAAAAEATDAGEVLLDLEAAEAETAAPVIAEALASLEFYPGPNAAKVLRDVAAADRPEADTALKKLGRQLARGSPDAAAAMAELLAGENAVPEGRAPAVLDAVLQAPRPADAERRVQLADAVRSLMERAAAEPLRRQAAKVSAHLADVQAVKPVYLTWAGMSEEDEVRKAWGEALEGLVVAVAKAGKDDGALDGQLAAELRTIASDLHRAFVLGLFDAMGPEANRFELKRLRADIRFEYAGVGDVRTRDDRRKDLDEALRLYRELSEEAAPADRGDVQRQIYDLLTRRAQPEWLADGEKPEALLLDALKAAAGSGSQDLARDALEKIAQGLRKGGTLSDAQKSELEQTVKRLQELAGT